MVCYSIGRTSGLLIGPFVFVIFIGDLPEVVMPGNCVSLYADDCKTSRIINCPADHSVFQSGYINIDLSTYVQFFSDSDRYPLRGKDEYALKKNCARTNTFKFSFFNRIVDL